MDDLAELAGGSVAENPAEKEKLVAEVLRLQRLLKDWAKKSSDLEKEIASAEASNDVLRAYARNLISSGGVKGDEKELQAAGLSTVFHRYR